MNAAVFIVGATAVGKTQIAITLSKIYNGALISADSVQIFKGLDIISGKDKNDLKDIDTYLLDIVSPTEAFSVSQFERIGKESLEKINSSGKLPIIVGGTGLYVKALVDGINTSFIRPNFQLRSKLEKLDFTSLQKKLIILDEETFNQMNESDRKNKRRLIRKIEILLNTDNQIPKTEKNDFEFLQIGLELPREELRKSIDLRVEKRINQGAIEEAKRLFENYRNLTQQVKDANGYMQLFQYLNGEISWEEAIQRWKFSEYRHAKNQMTWFKKDKRILWFDASKKGSLEAIKDKIDTFLSS